MAKNSGVALDEAEPEFGFFFAKKLKRLKPLEPSLGLLGFFTLSALFITSFVCLDYDTLVRGSPLNSPAFPSEAPSPSFAASPEVGDVRLGFLEEGGEKCNVFEGSWVWDEGYPLYESPNCPFVDQGFRCSENGRIDSLYTKWRWQPKDCDLPRFDALKLLETLRNKRVVFAGDSLGRNQWESLLCMLAMAVPEKSTIREVNGNPITKHSGALVFLIEEYNCTVEYYRSPFLVPQGHPPKGHPEGVRLTMKVDRVDWSAARWRDADVLVLNTGHWWAYERTIREGCYFQVGDKVEMSMTVETAYQKSLETVIEWISREVDTNKTSAFFRTYSPVHFRGGAWNTGGGCHTETLPDPETTDLAPQPEPRYDALIEILARKKTARLDLLNVTGMTTWRKDGHPSVFYYGPGQRAPLNHQDCSHWCLPGVPDTWNELLYSILLRRALRR